MMLLPASPPEGGQQGLPSQGRVLSLDVLRAVAVLLVLGAHAPTRPPPGSWGHTPCAVWQRAGWAGVELFFALSGFLIAGLLIQERQRFGALRAGGFLVRRAFKLYPPYLLYLAALALWLFASTAGPWAERCRAVGALGPALVTLQNYFPPPGAPHLWSLAVEEHFYALLLVALLLAQAGGRPGQPLPPALPLSLLLLLAAGCLGRCLHVALVYEGSGPIGAAYTQNRLDALIAGALAAWLTHERPAWLAALRPWRPALLAAAVAGCTPSFLWDVYHHRVLFFLAVIPLQAFALACLLVLLQPPGGAPAGRRRTPGWLRLPLRALGAVGLTSYSTYLWHLPFAPWLASLALGHRWFTTHPAGPLLRLAGYCLIALLVGAAFYWAVEAPALALRRRWFPDRRDGTRKAVAPARSEAA